MSDEPDRSADPEAPQADPVSMRAVVAGHRVTFAASDRLPKICLRCGVNTRVKRRPLVLRWIPAVAYVGLPFGAFPYLLIVALIQKTADAQLPFCDSCNRIWSNTGFARSGLAVAIVVAIIATLTVGFSGAPLAGVVLALVSTGAVAFAWRRFVPPKRVRLLRIAPGGIVTFDGVSSAAADAIAAMVADESPVPRRARTPRTREQDRTRDRAGVVAARELGLTEPRIGILLRGALGMMSGVTLGLALAFLVTMARPYQDLSSWAGPVLLLLAVLGYGGARFSPRLFRLRGVPSLVVGADGVLVRGRFVHHSKISRVRREVKHEPGWATYDTVPDEPDRNVWSIFLDLLDREVLDVATGSYPTASAFPEEPGGTCQRF